jgi:hypothetical protein
LSVYLVLAVTGPGEYSLDSLLFKRGQATEEEGNMPSD